MTDQPVGEPAPEQLLNIAARWVARSVVVTVSGEIDLLTAPRFRAVVHDAVKQAAGPVVIDLSSVTFLGSAGLAALVELTTLAERERLPLRVVVDHTRPVIRPIEITGLTEVLALYHTVDEALARP